MQATYSRHHFARLLCFSLALALLPLLLHAQISLERELVGGVSGYSAVSTDGNLRADATFGQPIIGFAEGDLIVTVGFHQTEKGGIAPGLTPPAPQANLEQVNVSAYPNPTVERLVVDLNEHSDMFREIRLINTSGITVRSMKTGGVTQVIFSSLERLPNANYYLQGVDGKGKLHQLGTVMIVTK